MMIRLLNAIASAFRWNEAQRRQLQIEIRTEITISWINTLNEQARTIGYDGVATAPTGLHLDYINGLVDRDTESILNTWDNDVQRQLEKLWRSNQHGSRRYYAQKMEEFIAQRAQWKSEQIANMTYFNGRDYAFQQYVEQNNLQGQLFVLGGPAPTCDDCIRLRAVSPVDYDFVLRYPCPRHVGCPHYWEFLVPPTLDFSTIWLG